MGFFSPNFEKSGLGIEKDTPPKKGIYLFFDVLVREFWELIKLNLLFVLTCIPIVTIGAAWGAMTKVTIRMIRDLPTDIWGDYWQAFRENWKFSTLFGFLWVLLFGSGFLAFMLASGTPTLLAPVLISLIFLTSFFLYLYPMITATTLPVLAAMRNMVLLSLIQFYYSLPTAAFLLGVLFLETTWLPLSLPLVLFIGFSFPNLIASFIAWSGICRFSLTDPQESDCTDPPKTHQKVNKK